MVLSDPIQQMRYQATRRNEAIVAEIGRIQAKEYSDLAAIAADEDRNSWTLPNDQLARVQIGLKYDAQKKAVKDAAEKQIQALNDERSKLPTGGTG